MYISLYGKPEGLAKRLTEFAERLGKSREINFIGLGPIEDLLAAAALLQGKPIPVLDRDYELSGARPASDQEYDL